MCRMIFVSEAIATAIIGAFAARVMCLLFAWLLKMQARFFLSNA